MQDSWGWFHEWNEVDSIGPQRRRHFSCVVTDITVEEFSESYTIGNVSYNIQQANLDRVKQKKMILLREMTKSCTYCLKVAFSESVVSRDVD